MIKTKDGWRQVEETAKEKERRALLEREFPAKGVDTQYNSAALRILLLQAEPGKSCGLHDWQIFKALRAAIQKRGYGRGPWAGREARRTEGKSEEEMDAALLAKNESKLTDDERAYRAAIKAWPDFRETLPVDCRFPCYYDAARIGLWSAANPGVVALRQDCHAGSTRQVRFDRVDVEREIATLAEHAAEQWAALPAAFARLRAEGWHYILSGLTGG